MILSKNDCGFPKVKWLHLNYEGELGSAVKLYPDFIHQKSSKLIFNRVIPKKIKAWTIICRKVQFAVNQ